MQKTSFLRRLNRPETFAAFSGLLLALCYPRFAFGFLAWIALVPLLFALAKAEGRNQALRCGLISGIIFFSISLHWLTEVAFIGWVLWVLIQSVYFVVFAWLVYLYQKVQASAILKALWTACVWTLIEVVRSETPVIGVGWNLLAYSQALYPEVIQCANLFGAYGLGFLIVLVNACSAELIRPEKKRLKGKAAGLFSIILLILWAVIFYGQLNLAEEKKPEEYLRVSVLQGNIPQSLKWAPIAKEKILEIYEKLTELASLDQTDLILWPEAAFPGYFNRDIQADLVVQLARTIQTPLLIGGLYWEHEAAVFNSAFFINKEGEITQRYDKLRLVPFGEYIPAKFLLGWLTPIADAFGISDFSAGKEYTVFRWAREEWPFGVLICFEDVFPSLARQFADRGVKFLTVITNDAWFGDTGAPYQHLQASIFRAVENGVPIVRAANTGISALISYHGKILGVVQDEAGRELFVAGKKTQDIPLMTQHTFYRKAGHLFPYGIFLAFLFLCLRFMMKQSFSKSRRPA